MKTIAFRQRILLLVLAFFATPFMVLLSVFLLNRLLLNITDNADTKTTNFQVVSTKPKNTAPPPPSKPKAPKPKPRADLAPNLDSLVSGSSFGIDAYEWLDSGAIGDDILDGAKDDTLTADSVDQAPTIKAATPPVYPSNARKKGIAGHVIVNLLITPSGDVESYQIIESIPEGVFDQAALASVKSWKFNAAMDKGRKVAVWAEQKLTFSLN